MDGVIDIVEHGLTNTVEHGCLSDSESEALGKLTTLSFGPAEVHQGRSVRAFSQAEARA